MAGLSYEGVQLRAPEPEGISSRRHYRTLSFHHPLHNVRPPPAAAATTRIRNTCSNSLPPLPQLMSQNAYPDRR